MQVIWPLSTFFDYQTSNRLGYHSISASLLKQYVREKLSIQSVNVQERGAVLQEIYKLIVNPNVTLETKDILSDSIKLILIKSESSLPFIRQRHGNYSAQDSIGNGIQ
jgi:hypothetical protein